MDSDDRLLGQGSHGSVYDNRDGGRTVTKYVNIIERGGAEDAIRVNISAIMEPCALKRLSECAVPFVVGLRGIGINSANTHVKMVMDRCERLPEYVEDDEKVRVMVAQLFMALDGMHQVQVHHGDIKTDNVMVDPDSGEIRVIDFSLAHVSSFELTCGWEELYTVGYRPPEILLGSRCIDRLRADVWAAGVTACEIMLGKRRLLRKAEWKESLLETMSYFGSMPFCSSFPRWPAFSEAMMPVIGGGVVRTNTMRELVTAARGRDAADFIERACSMGIRDRWSAGRLLTHPYIQDIAAAAPARRRVYYLQRIIVSGIPRPHPIFHDQRNAQRELLTDELLARLGRRRYSNGMYVGAMNICSAYLLEDCTPYYTDGEAVAALLKDPGTFEMLSKHIFVHLGTDDDLYQ